MKRNSLIFCTLAGLLSTGLIAAGTASKADSPTPASASVDPHAAETKAQRDSRMAWWRQARFGMFIHWGLYAEAAGSWQGQPTDGAGEWIMHDLKIPVAPYAAQAKNFDPTQFNADTWVSIAKAAGMKYIVMTAKHHEGFAMYHTSVDPYNIYDATAFKRDPIAEMSAACRKAHIKFGVYYSQNLDWHQPGGGTAGPAWDPAQAGSHDAYIHKIAAPQVRELIDRYHPAVLWWDINDTLTPDEARALTAAFPDDPGLIANNRMGTGVPGDTETPEQTIPATGFPGKDWETCMTINDTWGYKAQDTNFKSTTMLLRNLVDIASKGGNYLLNVGPTDSGIIPDPEAQRLREMGVWLKANGDSIYGTSASPYRRLPFDGRVTVSGNKLYLNVFTWPEKGLILPGLLTPIQSAHVLATKESLKVTKLADGSFALSRPQTLDPLSTALVLNLSGPPKVVPFALVQQPQADGTYHLGAADADIQGSTAHLEGSGDHQNIGYWTDPSDTPSWTIATPAASAGPRTVKLEYSCEPGDAGSTVTLTVDGIKSAVTMVVAATASWSDYTTVTLPGIVILPPGRHVIGVKAQSTTGAVMNLRSITLTPASK